MAERILVVEDESTLCKNIARFLARAGYTVTAVETGRAALEVLDRVSFDLVITDLRLPDVDGLAVLDHVRASSPETAVLIMTAYASVESAVEALRRGAHDYILKPLALADLKRKVEQIASYNRLGRENARLRTLLRGEGDPLTLLRRGGPAMQELCDMVEKAALSTANVMVVGESGSGKELVARALHDRSERASGPFVTVDVSTIPEALVESYLFGNEGVAAGALGEPPREGLFRAASGGTLFLDEIGDLPLAIQAKLLRAVETKEILPVGAEAGILVDTRIVAATHRDLGAMVAAEQFRSDLLYRLQVITLRVPPLRERRDDIPELARHFVHKHARAQRKPVHTIGPDAMALLEGYAWPGNVRELSNVIERAVILASTDTLTAVDLPAELRLAAHRPAGRRRSDRAGQAETAGPPTAGPPAEARSASAEPPYAAPLDDDACDLERVTNDFHRHHIARVLDRTGGNREAAAKLLGLSPATFYRYLQKVGLKGYHAETSDAEVRRG